VNIQASNRLVKLTPTVKPADKVHGMSKYGEFRLGDNTAAFLNYFQLFKNIVIGIRDANPDFSEAQKKFTQILCLLAEKVEGSVENLTTLKVNISEKSSKD